MMRTTVRKLWQWAPVFFALASGAAAQPAPATLPAYDVGPAETSVSGLSSGGYMAVQFDVAHSATLRGAGIVAGGPYYCAQGDENVKVGTRSVGQCPIGVDDRPSPFCLGQARRPQARRLRRPAPRLRGLTAALRREEGIGAVDAGIRFSSPDVVATKSGTVRQV
jgi:hypothetical protein